MYQHIRKLWKKPKKEMKELSKQRLIKWRKDPRFKKLDKPTRIDKARSLGYKAKKGFVIVRARIKRGGRKRPHYKWRGRKPSKAGITGFTPTKSLQNIVEARVARKYPNMEVLNSYPVLEDGQHSWVEIILIDPHHLNIKSDPKLKWICKSKHKRRVFRGLTSSGRKNGKKQFK